MFGEHESLVRWIEELSITYDLMDDIVPDDVVLDHTLESLELLGDVLYDYDETPGFDDAAAAYIGQTLLKLAGGRWGWDDTPDSDTFGQPLACPSEELGLTPVAPRKLVGSGGVAIVEKYVEWEQAVLEFAAVHPDWRPVKEFTWRLDRLPKVSDADRLSAWLAEREQRFPQWVAAYGAGGTWDFSPPSIDALAAALFRVTPTPEQLDDPGNADFVDGATWYLGETLRRAEPGQWIAPHGDEYFRVRKHPDDEWSSAPRVHLWLAVRDGNPVQLHNAFGYWTTPFVAADRPQPEYRWAGTAWQTPLHTWVESIAGRIDALAAAAPHITLDYSADSLRLLERRCRAAGPDPQQDLVENIAAYVGEALLRAGGGCWTLDDTPSNVSLGRPIVRGYNFTSDDVSPIDLVRVACRWQDPGALTRAYEARERYTREQAAKDLNWHPTKAPTPGLDSPPAPTVVESWCAAREHDFPAWTARYGAGRTWDFSRDSLIDLAEVVFAVLPTPNQFQDPQHAEFVDGAAWYYGEVLRRGKPSEWQHHDNLDADGRCYNGLDVSTLERESGYPLSVYVVHDLRRLVERRYDGGFGELRSDLRDNFDHWVTAAVRQRTEDAIRRRNRKKSRRKQSDDDYAAAWTTARAQQFPEWQQRYGAQLGSDFSPDSLDVLESMIRQVTPTPEDLLENPANAEFLNGAAWYYGETVRCATDLAWTYHRNDGNDCYLHSTDGTYGRIFPIEHLAETFGHYAPGSLRRRCDRWVS
ncbi:hypothetical protein ACLMAL_19840 [Nocardia sp. CWNU-33]|uniref:hypothetical protein n=1 Tax=Nocardia sp. CWNU-33 TaxID=3392117 RepID=UPI00398F6770